MQALAAPLVIHMHEHSNGRGLCTVKSVSCTDAPMWYNDGSILEPSNKSLPTAVLLPQLKW